MLVKNYFPGAGVAVADWGATGEGAGSAAGNIITPANPPAPNPATPVLLFQHRSRSLDA